MAITRRFSALAALIAAMVSSCKETPYREVKIDLAAGNVDPSTEKRFDEGYFLRFSVAAMQSPRNTYTGFSQLFSEVGKLVGTEIAIVQRRTYREVNDLLVDGLLEVAFLCPGGYAELIRRAPESVEILAVPVIGGKSTYQSFIIVPAASPAAAISDLAGKRFAFADELSLSGRAYVLQLLESMNEDAVDFFGSTVFTHSHDRSVEVVARGLADAAAIDSVVYEWLAERNPELVAKTRIIHRSRPFGLMPVVVSTRLPAAMRAHLRKIMLELDKDPAAQAALRAVRIERFVMPEPHLYDDSIELMEGIM